MTDATNYTENKVAEHLTGVATFTAPTTYVGLATAVTDAEAGTVTEVANANGYARQQISATNMGTAANGVISNDVAVTFPQASGGSWGTVTHMFVADSGTYGAGNILYVTALSASKAVGDGDTFEFAIGDLTVTVT